MRFLFYLAILLLILFEAANVYFIMPMPGSQESNSIDLAYFLYSKRWIIRGLLFIAGIVGFKDAFQKKWWLSLLGLIIAGVVVYMTRYKMAADTMFYQPQSLVFLSSDNNKVEDDRIVLGIEINGQAKAYPIQFLGYHHQVIDTVGGKTVMVTYCTVCRSGRIFEPIVNGQQEEFRLVGMDHYNAMFEDKSTRSWWRQATGEAIAGPLKGQSLPELQSLQVSLQTWLTMHPNSLVMQPDTNFMSAYKSMSDYEAGRPEGRLTRYDSASWNDKSWIAGIQIGKESKAYDWNFLLKGRIINDQLGSVPVALFVLDDNKSLFAFRRNSSQQLLSLRGDTLTDGLTDYSTAGIPVDSTKLPLTRLIVYQEYWHSWRQFHPETKQYPE